MPIYVLCCSIHIFKLWSGQLSLYLLLAFPSPLAYDVFSYFIPWVFVCMHIYLSCALLVPVVIRRGCPVLWDWSFRWLEVTMCVKWIEPVASGRAFIAFNQLLRRQIGLYCFHMWQQAWVFAFWVSFFFNLVSIDFSANDSILFTFVLNNSPSCVCVFFVHSSVCGHVIWFQISASVKQ